MNRKVLLSILAIVSATLLLPAAHAAQSGSPVEPPAPRTYNYMAFAGYGYTEINMISQSRYGLSGFELGAQRNFGRYFGIFADGAYHFKATSTGNPGDPTVSTVLLGPELHSQIYGPVSGFIRGDLGGQHIGGESMTPKISFAGGIGAGLDYKLTERWGVRLSGDTVAASFSVPGNSSALNYSPHRSRSPRMMFGVTYKF